LDFSQVGAKGKRGQESKTIVQRNNAERVPKPVTTNSDTPNIKAIINREKALELQVTRGEKKIAKKMTYK